MAVRIASASALSVAANAKSAEQVSGQYEFVGRGVFTLIAKASATGLNVSCSVGGIALSDDGVIPYTGTAGTLDASANVIASQILNGGRVSLTFRNTTGAAITADAIVLFEPM